MECLPHPRTPERVRERSGNRESNGAIASCALDINAPSANSPTPPVHPVQHRQPTGRGGNDGRISTSEHPSCASQPSAQSASDDDCAFYEDANRVHPGPIFGRAPFRGPPARPAHRRHREREPDAQEQRVLLEIPSSNDREGPDWDQASEGPHAQRFWQAPEGGPREQRRRQRERRQGDERRPLGPLSAGRVFGRVPQGDGEERGLLRAPKEEQRSCEAVPRCPAG